MLADLVAAQRDMAETVMQPHVDNMCSNILAVPGPATFRPQECKGADSPLKKTVCTSAVAGPGLHKISNLNFVVVCVLG